MCIHENSHCSTNHVIIPEHFIDEDDFYHVTAEKQDAWKAMRKKNLLE